MQVLPEDMRPVDTERPSAGLETVTQYIHYMRDRIEFANSHQKKGEGGIEEAPVDGSTYGRRNGTWSAVPSGGNLEFPVGTVLIMSSNSAPDLTGTWTLVDKMYSHLHTSTLSNIFTRNTSNTSSASGLLYRDGKSIHIRLSVTVSKAISETDVALGTLALANMGVQSGSNFYQQYIIGHSDAANGIALAYFTNAGALSTYDCVTKTSGGSIASGTALYFEFTFIVPDIAMIDTACDKFYFERTA